MSMKEKINNLKNIILIISLLLYSYLVFVGNNRYIYAISYTKCIIFLALIMLLIYTFGLIKNNEKTFKTNIILYIVLFYILLISVTLFVGRDDIKFYKWHYSGQYEPFYTITSQLNYGSKISVLKNVVANSVLLIPLSFLLMIKDKKYKNIFKQLIIILPTIIGVELLQAYTHTGVFDIDDIILNYLSTVIFTFIITRFSVIDKIKKLFYTDYKIKDSIKYVLFFLISLLLIIYMLVICIN